MAFILGFMDLFYSHSHETQVGLLPEGALTSISAMDQKG